ncbi:nuclear transport factor 2 family protein [Nocardia sp. AG03]|uniref:nuclear transport factor 2 family protein n=1 Tax=Nocardia sp. AG03 TaxID=3025312 RepID=UPI00241827E3|nr:nuclear transport factor 2 family protein [Nocardia sp. AG03]
MTTSTDLLATLTAERAIYRTFHEFFRIADTGEHERFTECFTPDALIEYRIMPGPVQRFHGGAAFTAHMCRVPRQRRSLVAHVIGQNWIDWTDGVPLLTAYATVWHWSTSVDVHRPADWTTIGLVRDEFTEYEGRWLISHRDVRPVAGLVATGRGPR